MRFPFINRFFHRKHEEVPCSKDIAVAKKRAEGAEEAFEQATQRLHEANDEALKVTMRVRGASDELQSVARDVAKTMEESFKGKPK